MQWFYSIPPIFMRVPCLLGCCLPTAFVAEVFTLWNSLVYLVWLVLQLTLGYTGTKKPLSSMWPPTMMVHLKPRPGIPLHLTNPDPKRQSVTCFSNYLTVQSFLPRLALLYTRNKGRFCYRKAEMASCPEKQI